MNRKSFVLYTTSKELVDELNNEQKGILFWAILEYVTDGTIPEMDGMTKIVFKSICSYLNKDFESYQAQCEINRINGSKGGRPKGSIKKPKKTEKNQVVISKTEGNPTKTEKNIDIESDIDIEFDNTNSIKTKKKKNTFVPPTLEEIQEYINEKGYQVDAQMFFDYYDANNWHDKDGKPVKSWKQKVVTWSGNSRQTNNKRNEVSINVDQRKEYVRFEDFNK